MSESEERLLNHADVTRRVGMSRSTLYIMMRRDDFPRPVRVGPQAVRWRQSEVDAWMAALPRSAGDRKAAA